VNFSKTFFCELLSKYEFLAEMGIIQEFLRGRGKSLLNAGSDMFG